MMIQPFHELDDLQRLDQFIRSNPHPQELKRALAIQMLSKQIPKAKIIEILGVSESFIIK